MTQYLKALFGTMLAVLGIGCTKQPSPATTALPRPSVIIENDGARHEIYRGVSFEQITPSLPSGSVDTIDFDTTLQNYSIAVVTVSIPNSGNAVKFTTTFKADNQETVTKTWTASPENISNTARGVFLVPASIVTASTSISDIKQSGEAELPMPDSTE